MKFCLALTFFLLLFTVYGTKAQKEETPVAKILCEKGTCKCIKQGQEVIAFNKEIETIFERTRPKKPKMRQVKYELRCRSTKPFKRNRDRCKYTVIRKHRWFKSNPWKGPYRNKEQHERQFLESTCEKSGENKVNRLSTEETAKQTKNEDREFIEVSQPVLETVETTTTKPTEVAASTIQSRESTTTKEAVVAVKTVTEPAIPATTATLDIKNAEEFRRGKEGDEALTECNESGFCQCRSKQGVLLPGIGPRINCQNLTSCQREFMSDIPDKRSCDFDGRYLSKRCDHNDMNSCFCINPNTGGKLSDVPGNYYKLSCSVDCSGGMTYHSCGGCEVTCHNRNTRTVCDQMCRSQCACPYGSFWSGKYQRCVSEEQC